MRDTGFLQERGACGRGWRRFFPREIAAPTVHLKLSLQRTGEVTRVAEGGQNHFDSDAGARRLRSLPSTQ